MKRLALLALVMSVGSFQLHASNELPQEVAQTNQITWVTDIEEAQNLAKQHSVPIFLYFSGSDWCPHCKKMDKQVLATEIFHDAMKDKIIFMHIDSPKRTPLDAKTKEQNSRLKKQFGITGYPTVLIADADLNLIGKPARKLDPALFAQEVLKVIASSQQH